MAIPTVNSILAAAAALMGDPAQEQFTNTVLTAPFSMAWREIYDCAMRLGLQMGERELYAPIDPYSTILTPSDFSVTDMGEPIEVWERQNITTKSIVGVTNATPQAVTVVGHGLSTGAQVEIYGVSGAVFAMQRYRISVSSSSVFLLLGSVAGGVGTGGQCIIGGNESDNPFTIVHPCDEFVKRPLTTTMNQWRWVNNILEFPGCTLLTEIWLKYRMSGAAPAVGASTGLDNCQNFLTSRTISLIAPSYDMPGLGQQHKIEALGQSGEPDATGGSLRGMIMPMLKEQQKRPKRPRTFRPRMNNQFF